MGRKKILIVLAAAVLLLSGCAASTVDQMYCLPKRSENYNDLQTAIDDAMTDLEYCAPLSGENQQPVHMADLDGDGVEEYLVFTKGSTEKPLQILIFQQRDGQYALTQRVESYGSAYDQVEYLHMDEEGGLEILVGSQLSDQVLRAVTVYSYRNGQLEQLTTANYTKFLSCDLNADGYREMLVIHPGQTETDKGIAELYYMDGSILCRSNEGSLSEPADKIKRIISGNLYGGKEAVYVASTVEESAIITDVFTIVDGVFTNVSFSNESGTSVKTLRNYYVYAEDIDGDGVVELPSLITMHTMEQTPSAQQQYLIRWYAMAADGSEVDKLYTYHNFVGGWYLELSREFASRVTVVQVGNGYECYLWDEDYTQPSKILTIYAFTGQNREEMAISDNRFVLYKTDTTVYSARLEPEAANMEIDRETVTESFHMIRRDWKTGET